jgi:hypothetical protein
VQLLVQFATQLVLARLFGAASEMDAFVAALALPVVIATILSGSLGVLVPIYAERLAAGGQRSECGHGQMGLHSWDKSAGDDRAAEGRSPRSCARGSPCPSRR